MNIKLQTKPIATYRDGGSKDYKVLNPEQAGCVTVHLDWGLGSKTKGQYFKGTANNHEKLPIPSNVIEFV